MAMQEVRETTLVIRLSGPFSVLRNSILNHAQVIQKGRNSTGLEIPSMLCNTHHEFLLLFREASSHGPCLGKKNAVYGFQGVFLVPQIVAVLRNLKGTERSLPDCQPPISS